ncbi:MAG: hypothetical protein ACRELD_01455 [Longimicrobiales bacterium]
MAQDTLAFVSEEQTDFVFGVSGPVYPVLIATVLVVLVLVGVGFAMGWWWRGRG